VVRLANGDAAGSRETIAESDQGNVADTPHAEGSGAPGETRTHDLQVRNLTLYPLSYGRALGFRLMAEREGFEPSEQVTPLNGLANRRTRPLCDLSAVENPAAMIAGG
jgi:hypothetical protein